MTSDEVSRQLGTDTNSWSAATRQGYVSRLRTWLGRDADGELYLPNVDARRGGYRLSNPFEALTFVPVGFLNLWFTAVNKAPA